MNNKTDLYEQFSRLEWLVRRCQLHNLREFGPMANPHKGQGRILALLKLKPEISQKELSTILDIRSQSLGELLAKLERSGFITRTPSDEDRRVMEIRLTEEGKKAANQSGQDSEKDMIFGCLKDEEQDILAGLFERIINDLEEKFGEDDFGFHKRDFHGGFPFDRNGAAHAFGREYFAQMFGGQEPERGGPRTRKRDSKDSEKD